MLFVDVILNLFVSGW